MSDNKHILILCPGFPANEGDEYCMPYFQAYFRKIKELDPSLKFSAIPLHYPSLKESYHWKDVNVYPIGGRDKFPLSRTRAWTKAIRIARKIHKFSPVDAIHSLWMNEPAVIGQRLAKKFSIPHFISLMGRDVLKENKYMRLIKSDAARQVAVSEWQAMKYREVKRQADEIIPWAVHPADFPPLNEDEREIDILGVGGFIHGKAPDEFLKIVSGAVEKFPKLKFAMLGEGPMQAELEEMIDKLEIRKNLVEFGLRPRAEVLQIMNNSKLFLHPSHYESFGYAMHEALYSGMKVVSRSVGAYFPSKKWKIGNSVPELSDAVERTLDENFEAERKMIFDLGNTAQSWLKLYLRE